MFAIALQNDKQYFDIVGGINDSADTIDGLFNSPLHPINAEDAVKDIVDRKGRMIGVIKVEDEDDRETYCIMLWNMIGSHQIVNIGANSLSDDGCYYAIECNHDFGKAVSASVLGPNRGLYDKICKRCGFVFTIDSTD